MAVHPIEEMAASGMFGNAINYARFISHLDGTIYHPHFNDSFNYSTVNPFGGLYANGINPSIPINDSGQTWIHTGALDGTSTRFERRIVDDEPGTMVLLSNTKPRGGNNPETISDGQLFNPQQIDWDTDLMQVMSKAFTDIDYKNLELAKSRKAIGL